MEMSTIQLPVVRFTENLQYSLYDMKNLNLKRN